MQVCITDLEGQDSGIYAFGMVVCADWFAGDVMVGSGLRVLLVEDNHIDATIILGRLAKFTDLTCHWVESLSGCRAFLNASDVDAVLLDLNLADASGEDLIVAVRSSAGDIPIVILTNTDDERTGLLALQSGCQDYLVKVKTDGQIIRRTLLHSVERARLDLARRTAEENARQGEQLANLILDTAPEAMLVANQSGEIIRANAHACQVFGYSLQDLQGGSLFRLIPPEHRRHHAEIVAAAGGLGGEALRGVPSEVSGLRRGGIEFPARVSLAPMRFGDETYVIVSIQDLTAHKAAEAASRLHSAIFDHAREGVMVTDPDGTILSINPAFSSMTGYETDEVVGGAVGFMKSGRHDQGFYRSMWQSLVGQGHWAGEIWNRHRDGTVLPQWLSISAVRDDGGAVTNYVAIYLDITEMKRHEEALNHMAHHDALTGLPNRLLLADRLRQGLAKSQRSGRPLAVAYLDLDGFKPVNDQYGHHAGDSILTELARRMTNLLRGGDTVARLGGDEFVLVLQDLADVGECHAILERVLESVSSPFLLPTIERSVTMTASIGVVSCIGGETDADTLLRHADQAMYTAKHEGRNRIHFYDPIIDQQRLARHETLRSVRHALEDGQFVLFYQPKVNMRLGTLVGAEALIRWLHPEKGLLPPGDFLPLIDEPNLDIAIGEWVIRNTLEQIRIWHKVGAAVPVSVNIAADHLLNPDFCDRLQAILRQFPDVPPRMLQIEVVETAALEDIGRAREVLEACRTMGVSAALDDFGTGYSSLTYLRHLPIDTLKIDRSFVLNLTDDAEDLTIVHGVIVLANGLGRAVLAEGIEKIEHGEILLRLGCELGQGYRIAPPMPAGDFIEWQHAWRPEARWMV
jgi:diguanylate cyclase (GGDEF)-like protein/PAS domain S-box-containing protein